MRGREKEKEKEKRPIMTSTTTILLHIKDRQTRQEQRVGSVERLHGELLRSSNRDLACRHF